MRFKGKGNIGAAKCKPPSLVNREGKWCLQRGGGFANNNKKISSDSALRIGGVYTGVWKQHASNWTRGVRGMKSPKKNFEKQRLYTLFLKLNIYVKLMKCFHTPGGVGGYSVFCAKASKRPWTLLNE